MKKHISQYLLATFLTATAAVAQAAPLSFDVDAYLNSTTGGVALDTGIALDAGEYFTVSVDPGDLWNAGPLPRWSNADGLSGFLYATGSDDSGQAAGTLIGQSYGQYSYGGYSFYYGTLVGELAGTYFEVGTQFAGVAPLSGTLNLYYWDVNQYDNSGSVSATVDTPRRVTDQGAAVPEPGTLALLGLGLAGLALRRRARAG